METLWAPWRLQYVTDTAPKSASGCFFCDAWAAEGDEKAHLLLARSGSCFVMMNRYPYNNGHLMVVPKRHAGGMEAMTPEEAADLWRLAVVGKEILEDCFCAQGCNVGINQGKCAGAGVLDHLHVHVVPRWEGDFNFMPVLADCKVMPEHLEAAYARLADAFRARGY